MNGFGIEEEGIWGKKLVDEKEWGKEMGSRIFKAKKHCRPDHQSTVVHPKLKKIHNRSTGPRIWAL